MFFSNKEFAREIILDHKEHPRNNRVGTGTQTRLYTATCSDDFILYLDVENDMIKDCSYTGVGCAISTASLSIMSELLIGKSTDDAKQIAQNFIAMLLDEPFEEDLLEEGVLFKNVSRQPARIKCATIGYRGVLEILGGKDENKIS